MVKLALPICATVIFLSGSRLSRPVAYLRLITIEQDEVMIIAHSILPYAPRLLGVEQILAIAAAIPGWLWRGASAG